MKKVKKEPLPLSYYQTSDTLALSCDLLGKFLFTNHQGQITGGMIVETEAYCAPHDKASHAHLMRRTKRSEIMFHAGGCAYVYLCYGIYSLFNIITNQINVPHAILVRAIDPLTGLETMLKRRGKQKLEPSLTAGPGVMSIALGIDRSLNGALLTSEQIWLEDHKVGFTKSSIIASPRVGIDYAGADAKLPWRFRVKNNPFTSKAK